MRESLGVLAGLGRWWALVLLRQPAAWVCLGGALVSAPLAGVLVPLGEVGRDPALVFAAEAGVFVGLLAVAASLAGLAHHQPFLEMIPARARWVGSVGLLALGALILQSCLFAGAVLATMGGSVGDPGLLQSEPGPFAGWVRVDLHLAALGSIALALRSPPALRVGLFLALAWFLPALELPGLGAVLDPARHTRSAGFPPLGDGAALLGLFLVAYLLVTPRRLPSAKPA